MPCIVKPPSCCVVCRYIGSLGSSLHVIHHPIALHCLPPLFVASSAAQSPCLVHPPLLLCHPPPDCLALFATCSSSPLPLPLGEVMIKHQKYFFALWGFYHLGSLGIYFDKMDPKLKKKKLTRSAPLGAPTVILLGFVSDWTSDSHFTYYLPSKTKSFLVWTQATKCAYT
jgi:hypothetical protein